MIEHICQGKLAERWGSIPLENLLFPLSSDEAGLLAVFLSSGPMLTRAPFDVLGQAGDTVAGPELQRHLQYDYHDKVKPREGRKHALLGGLVVLVEGGTG